MLKRMLQERSSYLIGVTCNDERAPGAVTSRVPSARFRLSIRVFLALQAFSDFQDKVRLVPERLAFARMPARIADDSRRADTVVVLSVTKVVHVLLGMHA